VLIEAALGRLFNFHCIILLDTLALQGKAQAAYPRRIEAFIRSET